MAHKKPENLREALVDEAFAAIEDKGVENLSLRDIARRLGVSHQAPYKHFPSRDHILAAVVERCFAEFAAHLENRPRRSDPFEDLGEMGLAYLDYAQTRPLQYRLMFNSALPNHADHKTMLDQAQKAFSVLKDRLSDLQLRDPRHPIDDPVKHDALFIWSALHGLASLLQSDATCTIGIDETDRKVAIERLMRRLSLSLDDSPKNH